ncbi:MAG: 30S ribosomal protein S14 [Candidatus Diapherotrites archaeon]|nr:30S ribosomal protein S14 [Candidatus Diapherotrites archaeon]
MKKEVPKLKKEKQKRKCRSCGGNAGLIRKYNLYVCRRCFKELAGRMGFKKYD